jgi:hypothetical protein
MASDAGGAPRRASIGQIISNEWFPPGLLFIAFGAIGLFISRDYEMGDVNRMGPGWFPRALCIGLVVLGLVICWRGLYDREAAHVDGRVARGFVMVLLAMMVFGFAIERLGFIIALALVTLVGSLARADQKIGEVLLTTVIIIVTSVAVFVYALKLPFRLWPDPTFLAKFWPGG